MVKLSRLGKQVKRELVKSPIKAAILGIMVLVAAYFWVPLVWNWIRPEQSEAAPVAANGAMPATVEQVETAVVVPQKAVVAPQKPVERDWTQLIDWMASDTRTLPAVLPADARNPFVDDLASQPPDRGRPERAAAG